MKKRFVDRLLDAYQYKPRVRIYGRIFLWLDVMTMSPCLVKCAEDRW